MADFKILSHKKGIAWKEVDGQIVIVDVHFSKQIHRLNPVSSQIWKLIDGKRSIKEISQCICDEFEVDKEQAHEDIVEFSRELIDAGVLIGS